MSAPAVSVVVPTRDRPEPLRRCLQALAGVDYPAGRFEVVVVDDGGATDLAPLLPRAPAGPRVRLLRQAHGGPGRARNAGAAAAEGQVLVFTDDDCAPDAGWLRALVAALGGDPAAAAGGRTINGLASDRFAAASQHIQDLVYAHYNADPAAARFLASNNLAMPHAAFEAVGGFDGERFPLAAEDRDLCDRWRASGRRLVFAPDAVVWHFHAMSLRGFCRQHLGYGRGAARFHAARHERGTGRMRDQLTFHADRRVWRAALADRSPARAALLALWQACNAAGYAAERLTPRRGP